MPDSLPPGLTPIVRQAARIVLLDEHDRLLLFLWDDERLGARRCWITPGGGLHAGESFEQAARRELWEETGWRSRPARASGSAATRSDWATVGSSSRSATS